MQNGTNAQDAVTYSQLITQNTSQTNLINLNNQSVTNYINSVASIGEPNWNANYSIFLTHATTNYVNAQNISMRNYVNLQNTSQNYLINTKVSKSGDTMTGNLNLSANVNLTMSGGNQIGSNSTCIIIKGPTSRLEIC